ncbi:protein Pdc2p [Monosporozyma servazzii]
MSTKGKTLSVEQRYNICLMAERHPKWTQLELAEWAYEAFQLSKIPSQGTISRLLAKKATYMNAKEHEKDANRLRTPNNMLVRRILQEWISQSIWNGIPITSPIIQDTAQAVWHRIPAEHREGNGSFSYKWISNFLSRMDVSISVLDEEPPKTPKVWTFEERGELKRLFANVKPKDLFTLDETFLAYNLPLDYAQYETSSIQRRIEVATVMLCANLDGSEKLKPVVVGKYNSYRSFRNYFPDNPTDPLQLSQLGEKMAKKFEISYHSNRKAWLTSNMFHNWLARWDKRLVADNRRIYIVLDDSCSHRIINLHLQNITLVYTSSNSRFLPFNWGVLDEFKTRYRIQQYQALIELQRKIENKIGKKYYITFEQSQLTMSNAFKFINRAWDFIPNSTIKANWKSSGLIPPEMLHLTEHISMAFKKNEVLELQLNNLCSEYHCRKQWEYDMLLDLNMENKNTNFLSTEELVESSIIDEIEPENNYYAGSALTSTSVSQIGIDELMNRISNNVDTNSSNTSNNNIIVSDVHTGTHIQNHHSNSATNLNVGPFDRESSHLNLTLDSNIVSSDPNRFSLAKRNSIIDHNIVTNPIDGSLDSNLSNFFVDDNQASQNGNMFNVSTLIDKPSLFFNGNLDLDLQDIGVDIAGSDYFNDLFNNEEKGSNFIDSSTTSKLLGDQTTNNSATSQSGTSLANVSLPFTLNASVTNQPTTSHIHQHQGLLLDDKQIKSRSDLTSNNALVHPNNAPFEMSNLNQLLPNGSGTDLTADLPHVSSTSHLHEQNNTPPVNLQANVNIAKSLGNIIKHSEKNELYLSRSTMYEIRTTYMTLLKKIKKTRQQLYKSKLKTGQLTYDNVMAATGDVDNILSSNSNDQLSLDINLKDSGTFF